MSVDLHSSKPPIRLGVDLGGTKIEIIAFDQQGETLLRERVATPQGDYQGTLAAITTLVKSTEKTLGQTGSLGIGIPGSESTVNGLIKNANSTCLIGNPLRADLERLLKRPIRMENDANCLALSEATDGAGKDEKCVFAVILGTGVGGGIAINQGVVTGINHIAGEWGHIPLPYPEEEILPPPVCYCGRAGCVETWLSGPAMSKDHERHTGAFLTPQMIEEKARQGDLACEATIARYEKRLAKSLALVINILDPGVVILGGGISNLERLYRTVPELWKAYIFSDHVSTRLLQSKYGDSSGVRGAAWLWNRA